MENEQQASINELNFMSILNNAVIEMTVVYSRLQEIKMDTPETHRELLLLNGKMVEATELLPEIIAFVATSKPDPAIVGTKLRDSIELMTAILTEKTRIIKATPRIIYDTNDDFSPN